MDVVDALPRAKLLSALAIFFSHLAVYGAGVSRQRTPFLSRFLARGGLVLLFISASVWLTVVNLNVPEPYLDEVFHIPQATKYLNGRWTEWDDKITTPPGLYLVSYVLLKAERWAHAVFQQITGISTALDKSVSSLLRETNVLAVLAIAFLTTRCRTLLESQHDGDVRTHQTTSFYGMHMALNISLFPVIFFFSGLYYTDLWSTVTILQAYQNHLERVQEQRSGLALVYSDLKTVWLGIVALWMRQTNVFWVVVYFGGLEAVQALRKIGQKSTTAGDQAAEETGSALPAAKAYVSLWASGKIHDPPVSQSTSYDIVWLALSVVVAAVYNLSQVLRRVVPHICIMAIFCAFVIWNGGVVLGDKSNHVATLHLAQMLYIWPMFAFFSAPLFLGHVFPVITYIGRFFSRPQPETTKASKPSTTSPRPDLILTLLAHVRSHISTGWPYWFLSLTTATAIVHKSTIIHPFTLADNRHYMFYVFRYTILRHPKARYLLIPAYVVCQRLCWQLLCGFRTEAAETEFVNAPCVPKPATRSEKSRSKSETAAAVDAVPGLKTLPDGSSTTRPVPLSTAVLWLLASALSLITAPLVEPRYFIVPWVLWRLMVPAWCWEGGGGASSNPILRSLRAICRQVDLRLVAETAWFGVVNLATMYMFIARPYYWRDADGKVMDEGRLQRFMW